VQNLAVFDNATKKKQNGKLFDLTFDNRFDLLEDELESSLTLSEDIFNTSNVKLNKKEKKLLSKGLKFAFKNEKIDSFDSQVNFEIACQQLNWTQIKKDEGTNDHLKLDDKQAFNIEIQKIATEFNKNLRKSKNNLSKDELMIIRKISKNKDIVITKADKGNAVVIRNHSDYIKKMEEILCDKSKFECLEDDPTIDRELKLQSKLYYLWKKGSISNEVYKQTRPSGSKCGTLYGLSKVHKEGHPERPIISTIGTYSYALAKWLVSIIKPINDEAKFTVKDTFKFCEKLKECSQLHSLKMVSFDVKSLFTNVPTDEVIEIILDRAFSDDFRSKVTKRKYVYQKDSKPKSKEIDKNKIQRVKDNTIRHRSKKVTVEFEVETYKGLERHEFKKLLEIALKKSHFQFKGNWFDQIDGVAMGTPLGPPVSDKFMDWFESKYMEIIEQYGVFLWLRFVDDVFILIDDNDNFENAKALLNTLNSKHKNIEFTMETEINNELPFLDVLIKRDTFGFHTTVYRK
jgi:hypothetical protein